MKAMSDAQNLIIPGMRFLLPGIYCDDDNNDITNNEQLRKQTTIQHHKVNIFNACLTNNQDVLTTELKELSELAVDDGNYVGDVFSECCGIPGIDINILKLFFYLVDIKVRRKLLEKQHCFYSSCINGNLDVTIWLCGLMKESNIDPNPNADIISELGSCIYHGCGDTLNRYFEYDNYYEKPEHEQVFVYTCANNSIKTAKWLVSNFNIDIHVDNDTPFVFSCCCGAMETAKWLYDFSKENHKKDIVVNNYVAFDGALCYGGSDLAEFLYNLHPECFDIYEKNSNKRSHLYMVCYNLNLGVAKWLYEKYKQKGIHINDMISQDDFNRLYNYFDVRHPYEMYVIDWLIEVSQIDGNTPYVCKS